VFHPARRDFPWSRGFPASPDLHLFMPVKNLLATLEAYSG
jgi:hypothetical protein